MEECDEVGAHERQRAILKLFKFESVGLSVTNLGPRVEESDASFYTFKDGKEVFVIGSHSRAVELM